MVAPSRVGFHSRDQRSLTALPVSQLLPTSLVIWRREATRHFRSGRDTVYPCVHLSIAASQESLLCARPGVFSRARFGRSADGGGGGGVAVAQALPLHAQRKSETYFLDRGRCTRSPAIRPDRDVFRWGQTHSLFLLVGTRHRPISFDPWVAIAYCRYMQTYKPHARHVYRTRLSFSVLFF